MKIQKITNTRQQNFGEIIVLKRDGDFTWRDLENTVADSSHRMDWFNNGETGLLLSNGDEKNVLDTLSEFQRQLLEKGQTQESKQVSTHLHGLVKKYGEIAKIKRTFVIKTIKDFITIDVPGFQDLTKCADKLSFV